MPHETDAALLTITVTRVHVRVAATLLVGFALGYGTASVRDWSTSGASAPEPTNLAATSRPASPTGPIAVDISGRPSKGPERAAVTVVEFTDYQCPFCARHFRQTFDALLAANEGKLRYVVRNFPVTSLHADAQKAAEAAECAFDQGKFWEFHRALFERSPRLSPDSLKRIAARVGLNTRRFDTCVESGEKEAIVSRDLSDGRRYGVVGTPTFFINGKMLVGAQAIAVFQAEIDQAIQTR